MDLHAFGYCVLTGLGFGSWVIVASYFKIPSNFIPLALTLGGLPFAILISVTKGSILPPANIIIALFIAGSANCVGLFAYGRLIGGEWDISRVAPVALMLAPLVIASGSAVFLHETFPSNKIIGIAFAIPAIFFLSR